MSELLPSTIPLRSGSHSADWTSLIVAWVPKVGALTVTTQPGRKKSSDCRIRTSSEVSFGMHAREPV